MPLSPQQREFRRHGITGSQIAVIAGQSPWGSPIDVWREKVEGDQPSQAEDLSDAMLKGILFERPVIEFYVTKLGRTVADVGTLRHSKHRLVIATPDGVSMPSDDTERPVDGEGAMVFDPAKDVALEVKCPSWRTGKHWGEEGTADIAPYYLPQVTWEMAVTGLTMTHVVALLGDNIKVFNVPWDQKYFDSLLAVAQDFWDRHVLTGVPPPPDGSAAYAEHLAHQFPHHGDELSEDVPGEVMAAIAHASAAEASIKEATARLDCAKNTIRQAIGDKKGFKGDFGRVTWTKNRDGQKTNWAAVALEMGAPEDVVATHTKPTVGARVLRFSWQR